VTTIAGDDVKKFPGKLSEEAPRQAGTGNAYLDTFCFHAPDFPPGHDRYFMTKAL
jgi:hypothetical protein